MMRRTSLGNQALSINCSQSSFNSPKLKVYLFQNSNGFGFVTVRGIIGGGRGKEKPKREKKPEEPIPLLVTPAWVQEQLRYGKVKVLDASWGLGDKNWRDEYVKKRIPGSLFFDIEKISDTSKDLPHMLPKPIPYEKDMEAMGLTHKDHIVIYDRSGEFVASARVWWTLSTYGHKKISLLAGGLGAWEKANLKVDSGEPPSTRPKGRYKSSFKKELIVDMRTVSQASEGRGQIVDARSPGRFNGTEPEPRPGLKSGNIPGSVNIPYREVLVPLEGGPEMTLASPEQIQEIFAKKGIKTEERVITTCGSGVTASVLALALQHAGKNKWALYDGSWAEWGRINIPNRI